MFKSFLFPINKCIYIFYLWIASGKSCSNFGIVGQNNIQIQFIHLFIHYLFTVDRLLLYQMDHKICGISLVGCVNSPVNCTMLCALTRAFIHSLTYTCHFFNDWQHQSVQFRVLPLSSLIKTWLNGTHKLINTTQEMWHAVCDCECMCF